MVAQKAPFALFKNTRHIPETFVSAEEFWNEEKGELELPEFAEKKVIMATKISNLEQVGMVKLLAHDVETFLFAEISDWEWSSRWCLIRNGEVFNFWKD